jgi:putative nucleotidyltransferase with HDIG domain
MRPPASGLLGSPAEATDGLAGRRFGSRPVPQPLQRAFEPLKAFPALTYTRERVAGLLSDDPVDEPELIAAIEADPALTLAVVSAACRHPSAAIDVASVPAAVEALSHEELESVVSQIPVFDFFQRTPAELSFVESFRLHGLMTQRSADRIHAQAGVGDLDRLRVAALVHDIGKLVLLRRHDQYPKLLLLRANPEQRMLLEFRHFKMDHALAGGMLIRTLGLPSTLATVVERHHAEDARGDAAVIRLADMFAHYASGDPIDCGAFTESGAAVGLTSGDLRNLLARLPHLGNPATRRERPPLTRRQLQMLRMLAQGRRYKQIGEQLGISPSTVRSHLHDTYRRLGVSDRAQAVLLAARRGWIQ